MRRGVLVAAALVAATLTACSSSGGSGNPGGGRSSTATHSAVTSGDFCKQLATAVQKTGRLQNDLSNPTKLGNQLNPIVTAFQSLKAQAPPNVAKSIDDVISAMRGAESMLKSGNPQAVQHQMMKLAPKMEHDFAVLGQYVQKKCAGG
jgi:hypothetical protein